MALNCALMAQRCIQSNIPLRLQEFLKLQFPADTMDQECTWLMGIFCSTVVNTEIGRKRRLKVEELAGRVRGRLQHLGARAVVQPQLFNI